MKSVWIYSSIHFFRLRLVALVITWATPTSSNTALLVIDVQNCFLPGGSLAVPDGNKVIPAINNIRRKYGDRIALTVFTQDWHCADHVSFASQHVGKEPFSSIILHYNANGTLCNENTSPCNGGQSLNQTLWPDHCVINTTGARFSANIDMKPNDIVVKKGYHCDIDSYSGFFDNGEFSKTELEDVLDAHGITKVIITGLALDFCVFYTSRDAQKLGLEVYVVVDASRPVSQSSVPAVLYYMKSQGIHVVNSTDLHFLTSSAQLRTTSVSVAMTTVLISSILFYEYL